MPRVRIWYTRFPAFYIGFCERPVACRRLWVQDGSALFNTVFQATEEMRVTLDDGRSILATGEMLRDLADRLLALAYRRMDVSPTLTDALYDLSRAGSYAAMRELVSRFPMDENERAWIMQMLEENGQTE